MFKNGDKVRIKKLTLSLFYGGFEIGEEVEVTASVFDDTMKSNSSYDFEIENWFYCNLENIESINDKLTNEQRITVLEKEVEFLKNKLTKKDSTKFDFNKFTKQLAEEIGQKKLHSQNEERKHIIEKSKLFLEECKIKLSNCDSKEYLVPIDCLMDYICDLEFVVNTEKRTIVALLKWKTNSQVVAKGIAKCDPDDVFNENIGKAIALGRALELDVSKFVNAVQPMEVVVGHKVSSILTGTVYEITSIVDNELRIYHSEKYWPKNSLNDGKIKIIDDTNAKY